MALSASAAAGLIAGAGHVFLGPDHLAAVAPLSVEPQRRAWRVGMMWGLGHSAGVWLLAALALVLREALPIDAMSHWGEHAVGLVLIGLGLWGWQKLLSHGTPANRPAIDRAPRKHQHVALGFGALHGLAGTAHLLGVLPALLLPTRTAAVGYLIAFGLGSIAAMVVFAWLVGLAASGCRRRGPAPGWWLAGAANTAAIIIGAAWLGGFAHHEH